MASSLLERQIETAVHDVLGDKARRIVERVNKMAAKQGGGSTIENYQLLGKRVLIAAGVVVVLVQATASTISYLVARRSEDKRIERIARGIIEEERQKAGEEA